MNVSELAKEWETRAAGQLAQTHYSIQLPVEDAARIKALTDMYPKRTTETLIRELLNAALSEFENSLPYIKGSRVIATDEFGDPIHEDIGPTPRYLSLTRKHLAELKKQSKPVQ